MLAATTAFSAWLKQAQSAAARLTPEQRGLLHAAFRFRQSQGTDYHSTRLLSHFLLHGGSDLQVAQIARLLGLSRPTASRQQTCSSKEVIQQAQHRMDGRPYGKLLPRYAGPIVAFLCSHPDGSRAAVLDFIDDTFGVRVSCIALYKFLKKCGLDQVTDPAPTAAAVYRQRQHHEQGYRVEVYDEFLDAVPCGYDKDSPDPKRPRFHRGPWQLLDWLVALVYNAVADLAQGLTGDFTDSHVRTLRRQFFNRPGRCT